MSLFNTQGVDPDEDDPSVLAFEAFKVALHEAQTIGLHTHDAQKKVDKAFEWYLLVETGRAYDAGWKRARELMGGEK